LRARPINYWSKGGKNTGLYHSKFEKQNGSYIFNI